MTTTRACPLLAVTLAALVAAGCGNKNDPCATVKCGSGQTCNPATGMCTGGTGGGAGGSGGTGGGSTGGGSGVGGGSGGGATGGGSGGGSTGGGSGGGGPVVVLDGGMLAGGDTCGMPAVLKPNTIYSSNTSPLTDDYHFADVGQCQGSFTNARDAVFQISVPAGDRLTVSVTALFDTVVDLIASPASNCGTGNPTTGITCLAGVDTSNDTEVVVYRNTTTAAQNVLVLVDGYTTGDEGAFTIGTTLVTPPPGDVCSSAVPLNAQLTAETWDGFGNDFPDEPGTCNFVSGPDRLYLLNIPALNRVTVRATPSDGDIELNILEGPATACAAPTGCFLSMTVGGAGEPETLVMDNPTNAVRSVYLHVNLIGAPAAGETYALTSIFSTIPAPTAGDACGTAPVITPGMLTGQTTHGRYHDYQASCDQMTQSPGPDRVYAISVNPGQTLSATVTPVDPMDGGAWDPTLYVIGGPAARCTSVMTTCLAGSDNGSSNAAESVTFTNDGGAAMPVFLIVDGYDTDDVGDFQLQTTLTP